nr:SpoIID/LytB domain-containing protein [Motilibacter aurantiacus]
MSQYGAYGQAQEGRTAEQILPHYFTGTTVSAAPDARPIRVNLAHGVSSLALSSTAVAAGGGAWQLTIDATPVGLAAGDRATATASDSSVAVAVARADGTAEQYAGSRLAVEWGGGAGALAGSPATVVSVGSDQLRRGSVEILPSAAYGGSKGRLEAVGVLSLHDEYLYGLAEVPSSWPTEALRAQAIAARSYALGIVLAKPGGTRGCGDCNVYDTDASQVYTGWKKEGERSGSTVWGDRWRAAVDATTVGADSGLVVKDASGSPIRTYYFSSSGGRTRNSEWVWTSPLSYAKSVDDRWSNGSYNPNRSWTVSVAASKVASAFGLSGIAALAVTEKDGSDAATAVTATGPDGTSKQLDGEVFRTKLGLRSAWVRSISLDVPPVSTPTPPAPPAVDPPTLSIVYRQPGERTHNGRQWRTTCIDYGQTHRCTAYGVATFYVRDKSARGGYARRVGYKPMATAYDTPATAAWDRSPYGRNGTWKDAKGLTWRTTCTAATGPRQCTVSVNKKLISRVTTAGGYRYVARPTWVVQRYVRLTVPR